MIFYTYSVPNPISRSSLGTYSLHFSRTLNIVLLLVSQQRAIWLSSMDLVSIATLCILTIWLDLCKTAIMGGGISNLLRRTLIGQSWITSLLSFLPLTTSRKSLMDITGLILFLSRTAGCLMICAGKSRLLLIYCILGCCLSCWSRISVSSETFTRLVLSLQSWGVLLAPESHSSHLLSSVSI